MTFSEGQCPKANQSQRLIIRATGEPRRDEKRMEADKREIKREGAQQHLSDERLCVQEKVCELP